MVDMATSLAVAPALAVAVEGPSCRFRVSSSTNRRFAYDRFAETCPARRLRPVRAAEGRWRLARTLMPIRLRLRRRPPSSRYQAPDESLLRHLQSSRRSAE